ncbi:MAG: hypothetical protein CME36_08650 [unclassified Hahellaceae]|jgi:hypothetical protein|nr:hypothetical protein [Hahellaceae bacterium]|tara:strand:- start:1279 stop:1920 length:642 start_codon:yes stop_codon:yes gene_type:complete
MTKSKYFPPEHQKEQFHCVLCGVFASQRWFDLKINVPGRWEDTDFEGSVCIHCKSWTYWHKGKMIVPSEAPVEPPHPDLPEDCVIDYTEARDIFARSPRAAAALLRLCIQKLLPHLGEKGKNINSDIGELVKKGLPSVVQQALDVCRVVGNNAVHPGEIDLSDSPEIAQQLFHLINFIVEDRITRPKEIESLYNDLPEGSRAAIKKRDGDGDS